MPNEQPDILGKVVLLLVTLRDRTKVAQVAVDKLGVPPAEVHTIISEAFEKIAAAATFGITEETGAAITRLTNLYERALAVQDVKTALAIQKELAKMQDLYSPRHPIGAWGAKQ